MKLFSVKLSEGNNEVVVAVIEESAEKAEQRARRMLTGATGIALTREWPNGAFVAFSSPVMAQESKC